MLKEKNLSGLDEEKKFFGLYKVVLEREKFLSESALILQYNAVLEYFFKFLYNSKNTSNKAKTVIYWCYVKLGDIFYEKGLQNQDNNKYFVAVDYYNQALIYANNFDEKNRILLRLKDIYYYLDDKDALLKVGEALIENLDKRDRFSAYIMLAQNTDSSKFKAMLLEKALNEVTKQEMSFYNKYQDTLNVCSQLIVLYELLGENDKLQRIRDLQNNTLKLLN